MATLTTAHISIAVYKGSPVDWQIYRHTSLFIQFHDGSPSLTAEITGPNGGYEFETRSGDHDPKQDEGLARLIAVGALDVQTNTEQLKATLAAVPVKNHDREFNCQSWVENALKRWRDRGHLTDEEYDMGIDGMVDAIAEAKDEE